ncbi:predicted protein [Postia placenta Mad-698-R]|nr:predicted protein [Postia placenta Mad-698-R]
MNVLDRLNPAIKPQRPHNQSRISFNGQSRRSDIGRAFGVLHRKQSNERWVEMGSDYPFLVWTVHTHILWDEVVMDVVLKKPCPTQYTPAISTHISKEEIIGQRFVGLVCDRIGRKAGLVFTISLIINGATLCTAAHGADGSPDAGVAAFKLVQINFGKRWTFIVAAIFGALGMIATSFFVPDMTGVDLAEEDAKIMQYLYENGPGHAQQVWGSCVGDERTQHQEDFQIRKFPQFI